MSSYGVAQPTISAAEPKVLEERQKLEKAANNGSGWFFWIAGLSVVNAILAVAGSETGFVFGLGITTGLGYLAQGMGLVGKFIVLSISVGIAAAIAGCGVAARKGKKWGYAVGMLIYGLDGLIFLAAGDWLGVIVHGIALFFIAAGLSALIKMTQMSARMPGLSPVKTS